MAERDRDDDAFTEYEAPSTSFDLLAPESEERADSLHRALRRSKGFSLHVVIADGTARREITRRLRAWSGTGGVPRLHFFDEGEMGARALERWVAEAWEKEALSGVVVSDGDALIADGSALSALNVARDRLGHFVQGPFLVVLSPRSEAEMATVAPDLFDVRAGTWEFEAAPVSQRVIERSLQTLWDKPWPEISKGDLQTAAARLRTLGDVETGPPSGALADAWLKLGQTFFQAREFGEAIEAAREAEHHATLAAYGAGIGNALSLKARALNTAGRPMEAESSFRSAISRYREMGAAQELAAGFLGLSSILRDTGRLDEAQTILEEALQIYRDANNELGCARTRGRIADILQVRGQLEDALRIREQEELPVYTRIGDDKLQALTWAKIADILTSRGHYDEALRICRDEVLPIYERLNNVHGRTTTWGRIADILQYRGQLEDALQIYSQKVLPPFEALGDIRNRAVAWGRIARIHFMSGRLDEAIRIREEELRVYVKHNYARYILTTQKNLAMLHLVRGSPGDRDQAAELLRQARAVAERLRVPELESIKSIQSKAGFDDPGETADLSGTEEH